MAYVLIVVTYLGGNAWGPQVSMQAFTSQEVCGQAKVTLYQTVERMNQSNLRWGTTQRELLAADCVPR